MGTVNLTTEEYDALKNQCHILTPCEVKAEIEKTLYFGQNIAEWRDRAITAENRLASAGITPSWNGHECAMLKQDAALGRQVRRMSMETDLAHTRNCWQLCRSTTSEVIASGGTPEEALTAAGLTP